MEQPLHLIDFGKLLISIEAYFTVNCYDMNVKCYGQSDEKRMQNGVNAFLYGSRKRYLKIEDRWKYSGYMRKSAVKK